MKEESQSSGMGMLDPLVKRWKLNLAVYLVFAGVVGAILWTLPNEYTSQALFFPVEQEEEGGASSLLSLAKAKAGLSLSGSSLNQVLLLKEVLGTYSFADRFALDLGPGEKKAMFKKEPDTTIKGRAQMMIWCRKNLNLSSNAMTGIITLSASSWDQVTSQNLVAKVVAILNQISATMNEDRLKKQMNFLSGSREKVRGDLNRKDLQLVELERKNMGVTTPDLINQKVKLLREQKILEETYSILEGQLLDVEIKLSRNSETLRYLEKPVYPLVKDKPKRKLILLASLAAFAALHLAGLLLLGNLRNFSLRR
jgi:uncharacterized protein involved in exopolysaccharide biosynthesis